MVLHKKWHNLQLKSTTMKTTKTKTPTLRRMVGVRTQVLEPFCSRGEKVGSGNGGSYKWTCRVCSTDSRTSILSGSSSKVLTHFRTSGPGDVWICNGILNDKASQSRLKEARQVCSNQLQDSELAAKKKRIVVLRPSALAKEEQSNC